VLRRISGVAAVLAVGLGVPAEGQRSNGPTTVATGSLLQAIDWYTGVAGHVDDARARSLLEAASADPRDALAQMWLARVYSRGRMGFEVAEERARGIAGLVIGDIRSLAAAGDTEAAFLMGTAYAESLGVRQDDREAVRWYRRAAVRGHVLAAHNLGNAYRDGAGVAHDDALAVSWWLRAAHAGDAITRLRVGEAYEAGRGVTPDTNRALSWYLLAADQGNAVAGQRAARLRGRR
jgi:TPR repeat protein